MSLRHGCLIEFWLLGEVGIEMAIVSELYADTYGSHISKHSERLQLIKANQMLVQAPLMHLKSVIVASKGISISADAIEACCQRGIPIFFVDRLGNHYASLYAAGLGGTVLTRRAQLTAYEDGRGAHISLAIAAAKINNQAATLKYIAKSRKDSEPEIYERLQAAALEVSQQARHLESLQGIALEEIRDALMGYEGLAATHYWEMLRLVVPDDYGWTVREKRGATDPINSLLNYGYGMLRKQVERALVFAGLDPFAGFLHADRPGKPSLTLDLMEEFRSVAVDRLVVGLATRRFTIKMTEEGRLEDEVRRAFAEKIKLHLTATVRYEGERFPIELIIQRQARKLAAHLRGEQETYLPYRAVW